MSVPVAPPLAGVWRADRLPAATQNGIVPSGHGRLDAELPGGGWPLGALTGLRVAAPGVPWSPLLLPAASARIRQTGGVLVLVDPPHEPYAPAWAAAGVPPGRLLWLRSRSPGEASWLAHQALDCADVAVVLAWLPRIRPADLRRLHGIAARRAQVLAFVVQTPSLGGANPASCLPLRLGLSLARLPHGSQGAMRGPWHLCVDILKRRGPPCEAPLWLPAWSCELERLLAAGAASCRQEAVVLPFERRAGPGAEYGHALDRAAVAVG